MSGDASPSSTGGGSSRTLRRIYKELADIRADPSPDWTAYPVNEEEPYEWHLSIRGPEETEFESGIYHGRFTLPYNYPFSPPSISLLTPNGRFETNKKICLSISAWHPELWQPAWGLRTMIEGLRSLFPTPSEGAVGGLDWPASTRRELAAQSLRWTCSGCGRCNADLLPPRELQLGAGESKDERSAVPAAPAAPAAPPVPAAAPEQPEKPRPGIKRRRLWLEIAELVFPRRATEIPLFLLDAVFLLVVISAFWLLADLCTHPPGNLTSL